MWFKRLLNTISENLADTQLAVYLIKTLEDSKRLKALSRLNPEKIYIENIRSVFGVSYRIAKLLCETAVRQGMLSRSVEVLCPDDRVAATANSEEELPPTVNCTLLEDGVYEEKEYTAKELRKRTYYKFNKTEVIAHA
jgi:hypothetical protein